MVVGAPALEDAAPGGAAHLLTAMPTKAGKQRARHTVASLAAHLQARLLHRPPGPVSIRGIASVRSATETDIVFAESQEMLASALASAAAAVLAGEFAAAAQTRKPLLITPEPRLAFARAAALLRPPLPLSGVHRTAVLHPSVKLGRNVSIGARAVLGENVVLGEGSRIAEGASIGAGVVIGAGCDIRPNVSIYSGTRLGNRVVVHAGAVLGSDGFGYVRDQRTGRYQQFPQVGRLEIGDEVEIGANTTIDRGALDSTVIGRGSKLDNLVHVAHNVQIGENVVIAAQTGISGSAVIESDAVIGGQVGIGDHVRIESGAILGGQCGVLTGKVVRGRGVVFWGTPARPLKRYLKQLAALERLAKKESRSE